MPTGFSGGGDRGSPLLLACCFRKRIVLFVEEKVTVSNRGKVNLDSVLEVAPGVVSREVDGDLVVVLPDRGEFVVLNPAGLRVFSLVDGMRSVREIAEILSGEHGIQLDRALEDVLSFVTEMLGRSVFSVRAS